MPKETPPIDLGAALLQAFATNERMNQYLLENLDERAWQADPPNGKGRTIAGIVAHVHNVRHMWLTVSGKGLGLDVPEKLEKSKVTPKEAADALGKSAAALTALMTQALGNNGKVRDFKPDVVGFFGYLVTHDAHHRGQICMLARQVGFPLPKEASFGMWEWGKRGRETAASSGETT